jgi:diguanylate cyclase
MIDTFTILVASGAVVAISGVSFILNTVLRRNDRYGRLWSIAFVAGILETLSYLVEAAAPSAWWASAVGNAAIVIALAFMWAGCRAFNDRERSYAWVGIVAGILVAGACLVEGPDGGEWAGAWELYLGLVAFAGLAGFEAVTGSLNRTVNGRVLAIVFFAVSLYYLLRVGVFFGAGETSMAFTVYFGTVTTTFIAIVLVIVASISMSVLQPAHVESSKRDGRRAGEPSIPGVSTLDLFEQQARDWLLRSKRDREPLVLLELVVDNFDDITTAFGRELGMEAIALVGRTACENTPSASLVGYLSNERFIVLTTPPTFGSPIDIAQRLQTALVETPVDTLQGVRATVTFGLATTDEFGYSLAELELASRDAMRAAQAESPGSVTVARRVEGSVAP